MTIKAIYKISLICLLALLSNCSSAPISVNYYTLNKMDVTVKSKVLAVDKEQKSLILLSPVKLADFLATGALVMQLKSHQLQLSNQHRWADNLSDSITRSLLVNLTTTALDYNFEKNELHWKNNYQANVNISLEQFTVLADNTTLTSGTFWLLDKNNALIDKQSFNIKKPLNKDGYNHAVAQLESSLMTLAEKIESSIEKLK